MKDAHEVGPVTRYLNAEAENEHLRMLLINLTTAACPYARLPDASEALQEAHREASEALCLGCPNCARMAASYLSEE